MQSDGKSRHAEIFRPPHLAMTSWSVSVLRYQHVPVLDALAAGSIAAIPSFLPLDLANTSWAFSTMECTNQPLLNAIAAASIPLSSQFGAQEIALMADACLATSNIPDLESRLHALVNAAASELLQGQEKAECWMQEVRVDRLGWMGTEMLQKLLTLSSPSFDFQTRASEVAKQTAAKLQQPPQPVTAEIIAVAHLRVPSRGLDAIIVRGPSTVEHHTGLPHLLRAIQLPLSRWVDRARCSEFRALEEVCTKLSVDASGANGELDLWIFGAPPCLSCVAAVQQARRLFPNLEIRVGFSKSSSVLETNLAKS